MKKHVKTAKSRLGTISELQGFLWERRLWCLIPMVAVLVTLGLLLVFAQASGIAPFIYTLF